MGKLSNSSDTKKVLAAIVTLATLIFGSIFFFVSVILFANSESGEIKGNRKHRQENETLHEGRKDKRGR